MIRGWLHRSCDPGAMEVAQNGDLANWIIPDKVDAGIGGAKDLVVGVKRIVVVMDHTTREGEPKLLES